MNELVTSPYFSIALTLLVYLIGIAIGKRAKWTIMNPFLIASALLIVLLLLLQISEEQYMKGGQYIYIFLMPATVCLALPVYRRLKVLIKNFLPVVIGCAVGAASCMLCVYFLSMLFGLDDIMMRSLLPKSITTPFGIAVSESIGGIPAVTVVSIIITGLFGAVLAPLLIKLFRIKEPVVQGLAIGASAHVIGTTKALTLGETQGAMSGIAIVMTGLATVLYSLFL